MVRILYWNIENFSIRKINDTKPATGKRKRGGGAPAALPVPTQASTTRKDYIVDTFGVPPGGPVGPNVPHIFSVVETSTGSKKQGTLISDTGGQQGAIDLLNAIRTATGNPLWMLVPPIVVGATTLAEGVSVYYDSSRLFFTGPFVWNGTQAVSPVGAAPVAYTGNWANTLPAAATPLLTTAPGIINPGIAQNRLAGQWLFLDGKGKKMQFPGSADRPPFLTTFWDIAGNRNIKLLSYHAPPAWNVAAKGTAKLGKIAEMTTGLGAQDVGVITGDFNVNLFNTVYEPIAYNDLTKALTSGGAGYTRQVNPTTNATMPDMAYSCTTIKALYDTRKNRNLGAAPWAGNVAGGTIDFGYPGYYYMVPNSYDNFLTRYGAAAGGPAQNITIVNRVVGTPYDLIAPTPAGVPSIGGLTYASALAGGTGAGQVLPLPPPAPGGYAYNTAGVKAAFRALGDYEKIRTTSDHLPLIIEV